MSKLEDVDIRTRDVPLQEIISDIVTFWNLGKFDFQVVSTAPTDTPSGAEIRFFNSGAGSFRLYCYFPSVGWKYAALS